MLTFKGKARGIKHEKGDESKPGDKYMGGSTFLVRPARKLYYEPHSRDYSRGHNLIFHFFIVG